jgi:DNA-binding PadR family transcriptional regulator
MERGALRGVLLDLLREAPKHGYELIRCFEERTQGRYVPSPGVLYPTLQLLEDQALVTSEPEGGRRVYRITEAGQAEWETHAEAIAAFWGRFTAEAANAAGRHEVGFLQDALDDLSRTVWNRLREALARGDEGTIRRVREAVEECENRVRAIIAASADADPGMDA